MFSEYCNLCAYSNKLTTPYEKCVFSINIKEYNVCVIVVRAEQSRYFEDKIPTLIFIVAFITGIKPLILLHNR